MISNLSYNHPDRFLVSVDCIIVGFFRDELKILTFKRDIAPNRGQLSLIGGFIFQTESLDQAAQRVLKLHTGLTDISMHQIGAYGNVNRDPGGRVISIAFCALINVSEQNSFFIEKHPTQWISLSECDQLIFDHKEMVSDTMTFIKQKANTFSIGFDLLPEKFTLTQLQSLYESIYGESLDKRNFRKKVFSLSILNKLEEKDKLHSRKGAFYYTLSPTYFERLKKEDYSFKDY